MEKRFLQWKNQCLNKLDQSRKGGVDREVEHVVSAINRREEFFTTSSCSGRFILVDTVQKKNCVWLFVSHDTCTAEDLVSALTRSSGNAVFKFEPLVLHVQCQRLEDAQLMHSVAVNSGFRNSGLTVGKTGKIIAAVRSTHGLEVPLSQEGKLVVGPEYLHFLCQLANQKMEENLRRIHRFYQNLQAALPEENLQRRADPQSLLSQEAQEAAGAAAADQQETNGVYRRRRRREKHEEKNRGLDDAAGSWGVPQLDHSLELFTSRSWGTETTFD